MGQRKSKRRRTVLSPVRVMGMDLAGKPFLELAHTLDLSPEGTCLAGLHSPLEISATVILRYEHRQSRFCVVWNRASAGGTGFQLGLKCLEPQKDIWRLGAAPAPESDDYEEPVLDSSPERRRCVRHPIDLWAELAPDESNCGHWVRLGDIGLNGCYCWTANTLPVLSRVRMTMNLSKSKVAAMGVVRTSHPMVGMGIEFSATASPEDRRQLSFLLDSLQESKQVAPTVQQEPDSVSLANERIRAATELCYTLATDVRSSEPSASAGVEFENLLKAVKVLFSELSLRGSDAGQESRRVHSVQRCLSGTPRCRARE